MKKLKYILLGAFTYLLIGNLFTNYGNVSAHRNINSLVVERFMTRYVNTIFKPQYLENYLFVLNGSKTLPGTFINAGGLFEIEESEISANPMTWIVHGGYSADEPEVYASFRHFYDPTEPAGNRYLHNHLDAMDASGVVDNPQIDHLEWALDHPDHEYNWENGKDAVLAAIAASNQEYKDELMAFAWRALGEALHMIADMGCPAHVRDDAHAAESFTGYKLGSPDPYEEIFEEISVNEGINTLYQKGKLDASLKSSFENARTMQEIATILAEYSNQNFFTTQTISGSEVMPIIHPEKTYASPKLDQCEYDPIDAMYIKNISGNEVLMCCDLKYTLGIFRGTGYPYINKACTYSQAQALLPQIVEAGANVMRLFIPELKVEITEYDQDNKLLKGKVTHKTNREYTRQAKYNGKVSIYNVKNRKKIIDVVCEDGSFEAEVKPIKFYNVNWDEYGIFAELELGGIYVRSKDFKDEILAPFDAVSISIECPNLFISDGTDLISKYFSVSSYGGISDHYEFGSNGFHFIHNIDNQSFDASGFVANKKLTSVKIKQSWETITNGVREYSSESFIAIQGLEIPFEVIDSLVAFRRIYVIEAKAGMLNQLYQRSEYYYSGSYYKGSGYESFNPGIFANGGTISFYFSKY